VRRSLGAGRPPPRRTNAASIVDATRTARAALRDGAGPRVRTVLCMTRPLLAAIVLAALAASTAFGQDETIDRPDEIEFARALVEHGYPDLAERFLGMLVRRGERGSKATAPARLGLLEARRRSAMRLEGPAARRRALRDVLAETDAFIDAYADTAASRLCREGLAQLCGAIGDATTACVQTATDAAAAEELRADADAIFRRAEREAQTSIAALEARVARGEPFEAELFDARWAAPRLLYRHALLFPRGSADRKALCESALRAFEEFEGGWGLATLRPDIDVALCLHELGRDESALETLDRVIRVRESFGEKEAGVWPVGDREVVAIVCEAMHRKFRMLRELGRDDAALATGADYFVSTRDALSVPSAPRFACELAVALIDRVVSFHRPWR